MNEPKRVDRLSKPNAKSSSPAKGGVKGSRQVSKGNRPDARVSPPVKEVKVSRSRFPGSERELSLRAALEKSENVGEAIDMKMRDVERKVDRELGVEGGQYVRDDHAVQLFAEQCLQLLREKFRIVE